MSVYIEFADLLDKLALEVESQPVAAPPATPVVKTAAANAAPSKAMKLAELVQSTTGEEMPSDVAERIASDETLLEHVTKLAESGARPNSLGDAVTREGTAAPTTQREKTAAAWTRWNNSVLNHG